MIYSSTAVELCALSFFLGMLLCEAINIATIRSERGR